MNIKEFWDEKHREKNLASLSGHPGQTIVDGLYIKHLIETGKAILEIGVGLGYCTKDLQMMGLKVSVVDISEIAIARVKDWTVNTYLDTNISALPSDAFDIAISYCVTQHINNETLAAQLKEVIRSLKSDGTFAMQYSFPLYCIPTSETLEMMQAGAVNRPVEVMYKMVADAGGLIVYSRIYGIYPQYSSGWDIIHIRRAV